MVAPFENKNQDLIRSQPVNAGGLDRHIATVGVLEYQVVSSGYGGIGTSSQFGCEARDQEVPLNKCLVARCVLMDHIPSLF